MARHSSLESPGGPKTPQRGRVLFHLVHEHGYWVLDAREENASNVHSKALAQHASCSVLYSTRFGLLDVGLKIRHLTDLVDLFHQRDEVYLLDLVTAALARDVLHHNNEPHFVQATKGYNRLALWLMHHPGLVVPEECIRTLKH